MMIRILDPEPFLTLHEPFSVEQITENIVQFLYTFEEMWGELWFTDEKSELACKATKLTEIQKSIAFTISMEE